MVTDTDAVLEEGAAVVAAFSVCCTEAKAALAALAATADCKADNSSLLGVMLLPVGVVAGENNGGGGGKTRGTGAGVVG